MKKAVEFLRPVGWLVIFILLQSACVWPAVKLTGSTVSGMLVGLALSNILMIGFLLFRRVVPSDFRWSMKLGRDSLLAIPGMVVMMLIIGFISEWLDLPDTMGETFEELIKGCPLISVVVLGMLGPAGEEFLFRGAIQSWFVRQGVSPYVAIICSAAIFGIIHINPAQVFFAFCMGLYLGFVYYKTGSLVPAIVAHIVNNSYVVISMLI